MWISCYLLKETEGSEKLQNWKDHENGKDNDEEIVRTIQGAGKKEAGINERKEEKKDQQRWAWRRMKVELHRGIHKLERDICNAFVIETCIFLLYLYDDGDERNSIRIF